MKSAASMVAALLAMSTAAHAEPGEWVTKDIQGPAGKKFFVSQVASTEHLTNAENRQQKATLSVRCDQQGLYVTFLWPEFVAGDTYDGTKVDVLLTVDNGKPREAKLRKVDQAAIALGKDGFKLLKDVQKGKSLTVHIPDMHGGQTATFPIEGVATIYTNVTAGGCG